MTKIQKAILFVVREKGHLTADEVYTQIKKEVSNIALGTVYRNLAQFAENKIIRRISRANAPDFFDGNTAAHDHIICIDCGKARDIKLPGLPEFVRAHANVEILSVELSANYVCSQCTAK
ncbi:MAG: transcriptional repressor [Defluviitaleaceae bacterium]|nr:transcriptional repressor [Defluviitaleaceae bacterium]